MNESKQGITAPGANVPLTIQQIQANLRTDLQCAIASLTAIQSDPDLLQEVAVFIAGRMANHVAKQVVQAEN